MTLVITRYFDSAAKARDARFELLHRRRFPLKIVHLFEDGAGLADTLTRMQVDADTAQTYQNKVAQTGAVLMVEAGHRPLGVAKTARTVMDDMGAEALPDLTQQVYVNDDNSPPGSVFRHHPHILHRPRDPLSSNHHMADWPIGLISRRKPFRQSVFPPHSRMASWPIGLLLPGSTRFGRFPFDFLIPGHKHQANRPIGLLLPGSKRYGRFPFGLLIPGHKFQAKFPFGHLIPGHKFQAKFPFGHIIPGHPRMANWPFPLLINGKQGQNALVPGHKYMAKFPFAHLVPGHKYMAKIPFGHIVPGHKYMAKFPFGHIVPGHKFMAKFPFAHIVPGHKYMAKFPFGHIVPGHKYMANFIFPHTKTRAS